MKQTSWAFKEFKYQGLPAYLTFSLLVLAYMALGLSVSFQSAVSEFLNKKSREILGADLSISSSQPFNKNEMEELEAQFAFDQTSQTIEFLGNIRTDSTTALSEIFAVDESYPLIGSIKTGSGAPLNEILNQGRLVIDAEIQDWLEAPLKTKVAIGALESEVADVILEDPTISRSTVVIAPRSYLKQELAESTGLLQFGSQITFRKLYLLNTPLSQNQLEEIEAFGEEKGWTIQSPREVLRGIETSLNAIGLFLNWLSLLIVFIGFLMGLYLTQILLRQASQRIGVLSLLGMKIRRIQTLYGTLIFTIQLTALVTALVVLKIVFNFFANPWLAKLPIQLTLQLSASTLLSLCVALILSSALFFWPFLSQIGRLQMQNLLEKQSAFLPQSRTTMTSSIAMIFVFFAATGAALKDVRFALVWLLGFAVLLGLYWVWSRLIARRLAQLTSIPWLRIVFLQMGQVKFATLLLFIALTQVSFSLILTPMLTQATLTQMGATQKSEETPDLFALNIQPEDLNRFSADLEARGLELRYPSPFLLGRLTHVNGTLIENPRLTKRPVRISYRDAPLSSEKVIAGVNSMPKQDPNDPVGLLSMEEGFAERFGFALDDELDFELGGIELKAKVVQIRRIQWESFQPNFFMQFSDGWINHFPKTYIGIVFGMSPGTKAKIQADLIKSFPNLTLIDLSRSIEKVVSLTKGFVDPIERAGWVQAAFVWLVAFGVLFFYLSSRMGEIAVFSWLNAPLPWIKRLFLVENLVLAFFAWVSASAMAWIASYLILKHQFKTDFYWNWTPMFITFWAIGIAVLLTSVFIFSTLNKKQGQERELLAE